MRTLGLELRYAARSIRKRPAMSAVIIITLALGLGANAAIFSIVDALVLRPFTLPDVDRIALIGYTRDDDPERRNALTPADFVDFKAQTDAFEHFSAFQWWQPNLVGRDEPENVQGFRVTSDFFPALGITMPLGRNFLADEEVQGRHQRVILGHDLWQRRFAADPAIVGRAIELDAVDYEVIGVAPPGFDFPMGSQVWAPLSFTAEDVRDRRAQMLTGIGRLAPGRSLRDAAAEIAVAGERLTQDHPATNRGRQGRVYSLGDGMRDIGIGPILSMWQASACLVLLIACANVASLLLARGAERQREMAIRLAIGANRSRIVREVLLESILLSVAAVPAALAIAAAGLQLIEAQMPAKIARFVAGWHELDVDGRMVLFTAAAAIVTGLVFGLMPALQASRAHLGDALKDGGRSATSGRARLRLRRGLVVGEMAIALPLLVAAGLSVLTVHTFLNGPQGFVPDPVLTMQLELPEQRYPEAGDRRAFVEQAVTNLSQIPGVESAAAANILPATANNRSRAIEIDGRPHADPDNPPSVDYRAVTPAYFETLAIAIRAGRGFTDGDREGDLPVAVVSASLARKYWPDHDPLGRRLRTAASEPWITVVGVADDVIHDWFNRRNYPTLYRPMRQSPANSLGLAVRATVDPVSISTAARAAVRAVDPSQPVFEVLTMRRLLEERTIGLQYLGGIMLVFGLIALMLAAVGVYGVIANMVAQRTQEIGVRMALGATSGDVVRMTIRETSTLIVAGVGLGLILSIAVSRLVERGLLGLMSGDAGLTAAIAGTLIVVALAAGYIPARRAAAIDPSVALRAE